jgi:hypothetical protein
MPKKKFKWVMIYSTGSQEYLRLTCHNLSLHTEAVALGFPHGIALAQTFTSTEDAEAYAERIDKFMNALEESIKNECTSNSKSN